MATEPQTLAPETEEEPIGDPHQPNEKPLIQEPEDITPDDMLSEFSNPVEGYFVLPNGKTIKLVSITEAELVTITDRSKKPNKQDPRQVRVDPLTLRRQMVAYSMSKAAGRLSGPHEIQSQHLMKMPPGLITEMQRKVQELSGFVEERAQAPDPMAIFG